ncbi:CdiA C-terminal domain-containing protein [Fibrella aquatilis]|uniref:tRNA nuclease CdiA C-terminal domain-containing protein n=1 Tax=Fibrella aquatilis TaxID=2817059 RepID=A0A939G656_9BACT|nr:hypothetical protein [Fibrella aquatilis]MBO0930513.1 hypothetical protein [Fibrella aquatilis]
MLQAWRRRMGGGSQLVPVPVAGDLPRPGRPNPASGHPGKALPGPKPRNLPSTGTGGTGSSRTQPSGKPDTDAKPRGPRARDKTTPKDDASTRRSAEGEDRTAEVMAEHGYDVEQVPPSKEKGVKKADYIIEGKPIDCITPAETTSPRSIWNRVEEKVVVNEQTKRVVLNLEDWKGDVNALKKQFADWPMEGLEEVIIITKDGSVQHIFP